MVNSPFVVLNIAVNCFGALAFSVDWSGITWANADTPERKMYKRNLYLNISSIIFYDFAYMR
jgi:hypothetical protein